MYLDIIYNVDYIYCLDRSQVGKPGFESQFGHLMGDLEQFT